MSPVPALRTTPPIPQELRDRLYQQMMGIICQALPKDDDAETGRQPRPLRTDESQTVIALNEEVIRLDRQLGRKRH